MASRQIFTFWLYCLIAKFTIATEYSVIIIGAGASGVAAASKLLQNNITNILILEAEPRIGGRIHSVFFEDAYVELGAQWCHGKTNNIVYELAAPLVALQNADDRLEIVYSGGEIEEGFKEKLEIMLLENFYSQAEYENYTMQDFNMARFEVEVRQTFSNDPEKLKVSLLARRLLQQYILSYEGAFYLNNVASKSDFIFEEGDSNYAWQGIGYKTILDILIHEFPEKSKALPFYEKLILNEEVKKIRWNEDDGVVVIGNNNSSYKAKRVIFTPSINVLKREQELFEPSLPAFKKEALNDLGMDGVMKVHAHFEEKWWPGQENFTGYSFLWDEQSLLEDTSHSWISNICCLIPANRNPKVLSAWITGPDVPKIELLSDNEISSGLELLLKKFFGNKFNVTAPDRILKSGWYNNPHFRGVYSYQTVRASSRRPSPEVELSRPLSNDRNETVLLFAGEASHPHHYSTVHGAIESGFREADRIIQITKK